MDKATHITSICKGGSLSEKSASISHGNLLEKLNLPPVLIQILVDRGFITADEIDTFLNPKLIDLPSPFLMKGMDSAVNLFLDTLRENKTILIYGDYDVDGTTSISLLWSFFRFLKINVEWHLPNRLTEGYGLHRNAIRKLAEKQKDPGLLITVDNGITAKKEVAFAQELGFKVIITDHHLPPDELPPAEVILNPKQHDCAFPFKELAGVGVAFFFIMAIRSTLVKSEYWNKKSAPNLKPFLDLVALGTIADVVPLVGVNRILTKAGLEILSQRLRPGLWALCEQAGLADTPSIGSEDISYRLAPRINAAGRMGNAGLAVKLMTCDTITKASEIAKLLEKENNRRKDITEASVKEAISLAKQQIQITPESLIIKGNWHHGVTGIVAARLVDIFQVPVIVFSEEATMGTQTLKGSGRSIKGVDLHNMLKLQEKEIDKYGGHKMAAGLVIKKEKLDHFREVFQRNVFSELKVNMHDKSGLSTMSNDSIGQDYGDFFGNIFLRYYQLLEPFGEANPEPIFRLDNPLVENTSIIKNHLKFTVLHKGKKLSGIGFGMADRKNILSDDSVLFFTLKNTTFRGVQRWELHAKKIDKST